MREDDAAEMFEAVLPEEDSQKKIVRWRDGSGGTYYALYQGETVLLSGYAKNKTEWKAFLKSEAAQNTEMKTRKLSYGIKGLAKAASRKIKKAKRKTNSSQYDFDEEHFFELSKLTSTENGYEAAETAVMLLAALLSSYLIRHIIRLGKNERIEFYPLDENQLNAMFIVVEPSENGFFSLREIFETFIIPTNPKEDGGLRFHTPGVLPEKMKRKILSSAYTWVKGNKKEKLPAPYRDTSVLLDTRFLSGNDVREFLDRNPWCTAVIYGKPKKAYSDFRFGLRLTSKPLGAIKVDLDSVLLRELAIAFVAQIPNYFEEETWYSIYDAWEDAGECLNRYLLQKRLPWSERFKYRVLLSTMLLFLAEVEDLCCPAEEEMEVFRIECLNLILPGCAVSQTEKQEKPNFNPVVVFETVLRRLISEETLDSFYVRKGWGDTFPEKLEDGTQVLGYLTHIKKEDSNIPFLVFRLDMLQSQMRTLLPDINSMDVLRQIRKERPQYLAEKKNYNAKWFDSKEKSKTYAALLLYVDKLPIEEKIKNAMLERLNHSTDPADA